MTALTVVVAFLCTYRLTLLVTADVLTKPIRDRITDHYVHPTHERIMDVLDLTELVIDPKILDLVPDGVRSRFYVRCRCGVGVEGDTWVDVASEINEHTNSHKGEMTTGPWWIPLLDCQWCASWWIGLPVVWSAWCFGDRSWWFVPAAAMGASAVAGFLATYAKPET